MADTKRMTTFRPSESTKTEEKSDDMSPFAIFATVLTIAYIIYYSIMISRDLTMKPGQDSNEEEEIEMEEPEQAEQPETVRSVGDGFQIGDRPPYQPEPQPNVVSLDGDGNVTASGLGEVMSSELRRRIGESVEEMEDIEADSQPQVDADTYARQMEKRHGFHVEDIQDNI